MVNASDAPFGRLEAAAVLEVLASGQLWRGNGAGWGAAGGNAADQLEDAVGRRIGLPYVHAVNSGTSANEAAIASLGLQPGDEVICPAAAPIFVAMAVLALGCIPVFADVEPETLLLDPSRLAAVINEKTRAVVAVHLWGMPAPMAQIMEVARRAGLKVVEDCAQAFGTLIDGRPVGTFGDACCFSLQQSKHISSGEGGIFATSDADGYARAVLYSNAGIPSFRFGVSAPVLDGSGTRGHIRFGHNHRISELQAAVALAQLSRVDEFIARRAALVSLVNAQLRDRGDASLRVPRAFPGCRISYWKYPILVPPGRGTYAGIAYFEPVIQELSRRRTTPFGLPIPEHVRYGPGSCPGAEEGAAQIRYVSVHHALTDGELRNLVDDCLKDLGPPPERRQR
jgi:perosamine synthetase